MLLRIVKFNFGEKGRQEARRLKIIPEIFIKINSYNTSLRCFEIKS